MKITANRKNRKRAKMAFRNAMGMLNKSARGLNNMKIVESALMHGYGIRSEDGVTISWWSLFLTFLPHKRQNMRAIRSFVKSI